jgi:hypothetical protein
VLCTLHHLCYELCFHYAVSVSCCYVCLVFHLSLLTFLMMLHAESIFSTDRSRAWCCVRWSCGLWGSVVCEGGATESGDKELSLLAASLTMFSNCPLTSLLITKSYTSRLARWTSSSAISFTLRKLQAVCKSFLGQGQIVSMVVSRPLLTSTRNSCCSILKMRMFLSVAVRSSFHGAFFLLCLSKS